MKFKLDENFGFRTKELFISAGHDVQSVLDEKLQGCSDQHLYKICCKEKRCLVTLDLDFSDITRFSPSSGNGIVVIRLPVNPSIVLLRQLISQFLKALERTPIEKRLLIVEMRRIRIHESDLD
jgi:predicted nuclease of predicted toxin-antitoxin system